VAAYVFTLIILFPTFLTLVYTTSRLLDRLSSCEPQRELIHLLAYGFAGLMIEWFLIGLSPWSNPNANPILMLLFQLGMFSFWSTVAFAPRLFLNRCGLAVRTRSLVLKFYVPYFAVVYITAAVVPREMRFGVLIPLIIVGYFVLQVIFVKYLLRSFQSDPVHT
jgi:hypothetical protein